MIKSCIRALLVSLVCAIPVAGSAQARTVYDGFWSVLIITEKGTCDRAYRYGVQIENGNVTYRGDGPFNFQGRVAPNGRVRVSVSAGQQRADGEGRLSRNFGTGTWRGQSSSSTCSGTWEAERRG
jgi:hypothetical protein